MDRIESAERLLAETNSLISLSEICMRLREVLADSGHTQREVAEIILFDPALTTRILRIVNSAYYGLPQSVRDISHALGILGEQELNNLVIVTSIVKTMNSMESSLDISSFWRSSVFSAVMATNLAEHCKQDSAQQEEYFISGLLLNIGRLLLYYCEPDLLNAVKEEMEEYSQADYEVETRMLGFDHADVGAAMAKNWNFSEELMARISTHHQHEVEKQTVSHSIMHLTGTFSDQLNFKTPKQVGIEKILTSENDTLNRLAITQKDFCHIVNNSYEDYLHAYEAFCGGVA